MINSDCSTALAVSGLASSDKKYFPQCSQVQYSLLPFSVQVTALAAVFFKICDAETKFACSPKSLFFKEDLQLREIVFKRLQSLNTFPPMLVTLSGIEMLVKIRHSSNAESPILMTLSGIVMLVNSLQPENAKFPILMTPSGIVMLVNSVQLRNAKFPMLVTLFGMVMLVKE